MLPGQLIQLVVFSGYGMSDLWAASWSMMDVVDPAECNIRMKIEWGMYETNVDLIAFGNPIKDLFMSMSLDFQYFEC